MLCAPIYGSLRDLFAAFPHRPFFNDAMVCDTFSSQTFPSSTFFSLDCGRRKTAAFTLIEVLVAMAIFSTVLVAINTVFFGALRLRKTTSRVVEEAIPINHALAVMRADLRSTLAPGGVFAGPISGGVLSGSMGGGTSNSLLGIPGGIRSELPTLQIFTTTGTTDDSSVLNGTSAYGSGGTAFNAIRPWSDVQKVSYYLRDPIYSTNLMGKELVRAVSKNLLPTMQDIPIEQPLLDGIENMDFLFYDGTMWLNLWDPTIQSNAVPQAIKVAITFAGENRYDTFRKPPLQIVVPIVTQARTTNQVAANGTGAAAAGGQSQSGNTSTSRGGTSTSGSGAGGAGSSATGGNRNSGGGSRSTGQPAPQPSGGGQRTGGGRGGGG